MFEQVTIPNAPALGALGAYYQLDTAHFCKVVLTVVSQDLNSAALDRTGYQVDNSGNFILDGQGHPVCTETYRANIAVPNVRSGHATLNAGWCRYTGAEPISATQPPAGWMTGHGAPTQAASPGQGYIDLDMAGYYVYDIGELEKLRQTSCQEVANLLSSNFLLPA